MARFVAEGFVVDDGCDFTFLPRSVFLDGTIRCLGEIQIEVEKDIAMLSGVGLKALVQTRSFRYHAWIKNGNNILRYESACDHRALPHKHNFDTFGSGLETSVTEIETSVGVPTLGAVIRELQRWHDSHRQRLL
jgi:hypothetical protein